jgi:hypothetical protein
MPQPEERAASAESTEHNVQDNAAEITLSRASHHWLGPECVVVETEPPELEDHTILWKGGSSLNIVDTPSYHGRSDVWVLSFRPRH